MSRAVASAQFLRFSVEELENRCLLSASLSGSTLNIAGTKNADTISVSLASNNSKSLLVTINGSPQTFAYSKIKQINIGGGAGDDNVQIGGTVYVKAKISGGAGNDTVTGNAFDVFTPGSGISVVSTNEGATFSEKTAARLPGVPNVPGASAIMAKSMYMLGPNSLNAIGSGVISPIDTVGYNTLSTIEAAYGIADPVTSSMNGSGQFIAIVDPYAGPGLTQATILADINTFSNDPVVASTLDGHQLTNLVGGTTFKLFGPTTSPTLSGAAQNDAETETLLDVEWAHAIAPDATIYLFQSPTLNVSDLMKTVATAALTVSNSSAGGGVVSMSFGGPEFSTEYIYDDSIFAAYPNVSFIASAGDTVGDVSYPAMSPYVTSVGGTTLLNGPEIKSAKGDAKTMTVIVTPVTPYGEFVWGGTTAGTPGTGGGISAFEPIPVYQQPPTLLNVFPVESRIIGYTLTPNGGGVGTAITARSGPDVSMDANPLTGVAVYLTIGGFSGWEEVGGTSLSAPLFAGVVTLANQQRKAFFHKNSPIGVDLNPAIYTIQNQEYVPADLIPDNSIAGSSPLQNDGVRNAGYSYSESGTAGTSTFTSVFTSTVAPGEFYDIGGGEMVNNAGILSAGPTQGGKSNQGLDLSAGWGSPNVNYLVPKSNVANADIDTLGDPTYDLGLNFTYTVNLTNIQTASLGQPIYIPDNQIDLSIAKTADNPTPNVNGTVTYKVVVTENAGLDPNGNPFGDATNIVVNDTVPAGETLTAAIFEGAGDTYAAGVWTIADIAPGGSDTLFLTATINALGAQTNTATIVSAAQTDVGTHLTSSATVEPQEINLSITKVVSNPTPIEGTNIVYTITVTNATGVSTATDISVFDPLPTGETLVSFSPSTATFSNGIWTIPALPSGSSTSLSYTVRVNTLNTVVNTASIQGSDEFDAGTTLSASVVVNPVIGVADLSINKAVTNTAPTVGTDVTYTVTVNNATGFSTATDILITDVLPAGESLVSAKTSTGTFDAGVWSIGTLASGASATLTIVAQINAVGAQTNTASITGVDQLDQGTVLTSSTTVNPVANVPTAALKFTAQTTNQYDIPPSANGSGGNSTFAFDFYHGTGTATFNVTAGLISIFVTGSDTGALNTLTFTLNNFPVTATGTGKYKFGEAGTFTTGIFTGDMIWLEGTVNVNKNGTISVNGDFYRIQGVTSGGKPVAWGNNGPNGVGGNISGQFSS